MVRKRRGEGLILRERGKVYHQNQRILDFKVLKNHRAIDTWKKRK